jgi:hypothetical protein
MMRCGLGFIAVGTKPLRTRNARREGVRPAARSELFRQPAGV